MKIGTKKLVDTEIEVGMMDTGDGFMLVVDDLRWHVDTEGIGRMIAVLRGISEKEVFVKLDRSRLTISHVIGGVDGTVYVIEHSDPAIGVLARLKFHDAIVFVHGLEGICRDLVEIK